VTIDTTSGNPADSLLILWTSGDRDTSLHMALLYGRNALPMGWWSGVTLLVWGASQRLLADDPEIQERVEEMGQAGVRVIACRRCAENLGVGGQLEALGCEVVFTGELLTDWLQSGRPILSI
jgi:hypothetical protein